MISPELLGLFSWALLLAYPVAWVSRQLFKSPGLMTLVLLISIVVVSVPVWQGASLASWAFGVADLPSVLFVGLLMSRLFWPADSSLRALWHLGGLVSCVQLAFWFSGWEVVYLWGQEAISMVVLALFFVIALMFRSLAGAVLMLVVAIALAFNIYGTYNSWLYLVGLPFALAYLLGLPISGMRWWLGRRSQSRELFR
ncbi:hypothetical protein [Reinekea blandensis]|uniref:Uncharacterized protein n=1 Tax=Reinekea blandensis MED297 TaxID=314283 RepID=A4BH81_9GAMM|nr:hypothetical protein [Reinekea blandensis]EAR08580.1 hypothetical protein MED297_15200 [Reinekea sp. MED297] [Reinekea blandensis MED297]